MKRVNLFTIYFSISRQICTECNVYAYLQFFGLTSDRYICWNAGVTLDDCCENRKILFFLQLCSKIMQSDNTKRSHELLISLHKNVSNQKVSHLLAAWWTEAHFHPLTETQRKQKGSPRGRWWSRPAPWFKSGTKKKRVSDRPHQNK